jgi:hypothetical protein
VNILSFDPGTTKGSAWARFVDSKLCEVGIRREGELYPSPRVTQIVLIELPRWYPREHKIDVNDLLDLAVVVGEIRNQYLYCLEVELVFPRTWKGTVPKKIMSQRILDAFTSEEVARLPRRPRAGKKTDASAYDDNILDAAGQGLWKLGRLHGAA